MICRTVVIVNRLGLHARAASRFVTVAGGFQARIRVRKGHKEVNGKSIMGVMMLAASRGTELEICAEGVDAAEALGALEALVASRFGEGE